jgi:hypothetical protein
MVLQKRNDVRNILRVRSGSNTVNDVEQVGMERICKAQIATLGISEGTRKNRRAQKRSRGAG